MAEEVVVGIRTLIGVYDGTTHAAAMVDSLTGRLIGDVWEADDAEDQIDAFLEWMGRLLFMRLSQEIGLDSHDVPVANVEDPRYWPPSGLKKLVAYWRREHTTDGLLKT